ncbi:transmembrane protein 253 [Genypterus blacodes]|uniref:transmembrane protein 253 n=1 Tax=Genypterus blacodes TaxID=154954 RepID=UPI003F7592CE
MTQNMFQEGLYQVYVKETPPPQSPPQATDQGELNDVRIHRWFGTVVNNRFLVTGVVQILSAFACILTTVSYICVSYSCAVSMTTPVWSSLCYVAAGTLAIDLQRKPNKLKVFILMGLNIFSLLFGFSALLANSLSSAHPVSPTTTQQRAGSFVAKGSYITFTVLCLLASVYILFLSYKGLKRYSSPYILTYSRLSEDPDDSAGPLMAQENFSL